MVISIAPMSDKDLSEIVERHRERAEYRSHIPTGPYFYDSLGYVHNELALRPANTPASKLGRPGILVRSHEWFKAVKMDERVTGADRKVASDLGQYLALALDHPLEDDVAALVAEVRRLRSERV